MATTPSDYLSGANVLVASGDAARRTSLRVWFEDEGATVVEASTAQETTHRLEQPIDLVVVDAEVDGDGDIVDRIKSDPVTAEVPVIQRSSADVDDGAIADRLHRGADAHLAEPTSNRVIVATAGALLRTQDLARRLEVALSSGNSGVFDWSIPTGRVRWNESLERVHGMAPGEFPGTLEGFQETVHPDDRERVDAALREALAGSDEFTLAFRFLRSDGSTGHLEGRGRIFRDGRGEPTRLLGLAEDVTERVTSRLQIDQLRRLASRLSGLRTSTGVLGAVRREIDGSNVTIDLVDDDLAAGRDVVFSFAVGSQRLDVTWVPGPGDTTERQAIAIGELAGAAIDRALRYESERTNAQILQSALQPAAASQIAGFRLDAAYMPARDTDRLGGDFFDVLELDGAFVVAVGDVAGHGLEATRQMGAIRSMLRTLSASLDGEPRAVIGRARELFRPVCGDDVPFTTVLICRVGITDGLTKVVSAGHPPPVLGTRDGRPRLVTIDPVPPLGVPCDLDAAPIELTLHAGEWLALFTDGVFERRDLPLDLAITSAMSAIAGAPTAHHVLAAGESASALNPDDRAVIVVERLPVGRTAARPARTPTS